MDLPLGSLDLSLAVNQGDDKGALMFPFILLQYDRSCGVLHTRSFGTLQSTDLARFSFSTATVKHEIQLIKASVLLRH